MASGVFLSYRREDSAGFAGRIYDRLAQRLGRQEVFIDVDDIEPGVDFVEVLSARVGACEVLVVIIGRNWLNSVNAGGLRRLDDPNDFVRIEIEAALARGVRVIPVLVDGAQLPGAEQLPESLRKLASRQAVWISHEHFASDAELLTRALERRGHTPTGEARTAEVAKDRESSGEKPAQSQPVSSARGLNPTPPANNRNFWLVGAAVLALLVAIVGPFVVQKRSPVGPSASVASATPQPTPPAATASPFVKVTNYSCTKVGDGAFKIEMDGEAAAANDTYLLMSATPYRPNPKNQYDVNCGSWNDTIWRTYHYCQRAPNQPLQTKWSITTLLYEQASTLPNTAYAQVAKGSPSDSPFVSLASDFHRDLVCR